MKTSTRYAILLIAGIADLGLGTYIFIFLSKGGAMGAEFLWILILGLLTTITGFYLTYRTLPLCILLYRGEPAPILRDERTTQILNRAARNAFIFLLITILITVSLLIALPKLGTILTYNEPITATIILWIGAIIIFYTSIIYYNQK